METNESSEGSRSRPLDVQPSSEGLGTTSEPFLSSNDSPRSALAATTTTAAAAAKAAAASTAKAAALCTSTPEPCSEFTEPSSDNLLEAASTGPHQIGHGSVGFEPVYISDIAQHPCTTIDLSSDLVPGSSSGPSHNSIPVSNRGPGHSSIPSSGSGHDSVPGSCSGPRHHSFPGSCSGPEHGSIPGCCPGPAHGSDQGSGPDSGPSPGLASGARPRPGPGPDPSTGPGPGPECSSGVPQSFRNLRPDLFPNYTSWSQYRHCEPQKQPCWQFLQVSEPGARGLWKTPEVERKSKFLYETLPRGHCLLYNWEEERATNHLDQVPSMQDGSESFFFRYGHQGLLTMQLQSPMPSSTTQKDSYQPPRNLYQPLRGKREAVLEMLLHHQICKEVQAEQEPTRKLFEVKSVTHHDYQAELTQTGPPAPTKPHDYRQEQPETFWLQRAPQLPGVSNIRTLDTPFRKNCSFSTPVPLSLGQPLPYEPDNYPHRLGEMSSLACQGSGQGCLGGRKTPD